MRYIPALDWLLYVEQNETEALAGARMTFLRTVLIGLAASIVIIGLTLVTINRYQSQLERLIVTDELTGAANRRRLERSSRRRCTCTPGHGRPSACCSSIWTNSRRSMTASVTRPVMRF